MTQGFVMTLTQGYIFKVKVSNRVMSDSSLCYLGLGWYSVLHNYYLDMSWPWPKVISWKSRWQYIHNQNPCLGLINWAIGMLDLNDTSVYTIIIIGHDPRMFHDWHKFISSKSKCTKKAKISYLECQGHSAHIPKNCVRVITPHCEVGSG